MFLARSGIVIELCCLPQSFWKIMNCFTSWLKLKSLFVLIILKSRKSFNVPLLFLNVLLLLRIISVLQIPICQTKALIQHFQAGRRESEHHRNEMACSAFFSSCQSQQSLGFTTATPLHHHTRDPKHHIKKTALFWSYFKYNRLLKALRKRNEATSLDSYILQAGWEFPCFFLLIKPK